MKRRYVLLLGALALFTGALIMTGCPASVKPQIKKYKVTLKSGGHGSVTVKPALPADGMVEAYTQLSFTAQPDEEYEVDTWTGAYYNYPDNTTAWLTVSTDTTVSVTFKRIGYTSEKQKYKVTLVQPEHGTVTVKPALSEDGMIPQYTNLTFTVTPDSGWKVHKWTGPEIWQDLIGGNEVVLGVTKDVTVSVTMIEEGKADTTLLQIDSTGKLTGVTDKYRLEGSLVLPETVTAIGNKALADCTGLTSVIIPDSVTSIGYQAFYRCTGLTGVTIGNNVTEIDEDAFYDCSNLMSITIPDSVTEIGDNAFQDCKSITSVTIGKGVTKIGSSAFSGCNIKALNINCKTVPRFSFRGSSLKELSIGDNVNEIGEQAFNGCTDLTNVTIPDSVTEIGSKAFAGCTGLTDVTIPDSVTEIGDRAFYGCSNLTSITIPDSVTEIGDHAFQDCKSITSVTIGKGVTKIGSSAFSGCNIKALNINCKTVPRFSFRGSSLKELSIGDNVNEIGEQAFEGCRNLRNVTISDSVTKIGSEAFAGCTGLTDVTIPDSVTEIGESAFKNCSNITGLTIGKGLTTIIRQDYYPYKPPFDGCNKIEKLNINCNITPPLDITSLKEIIIGDNVSIIGKDSFSNCTGLTSVTIGNNVTTIRDNAFSGCTGLTSLTIPDSVIKIGQMSFNDCSGLITVTIGKGLELYDDWSFKGCNNIKTLNINCKKAADFGFSQTLTEVNLGDNVIRIGGFSSPHLTNITIPENVAFIDAYAFDQCSNLTSVIFRSNASWKLEAYYGSHITIQGGELQNPSKAVQYLRNTYRDFTWTRH